MKCNKHLLDEVFVICGIIKVEVTETLIISHITKTNFNNCFNYTFREKINIVLLFY